MSEQTDDGTQPEVSSATKVEATDGTSEAAAREPRPRVFGKYAFFITVVPLIFYVAGLGLASYFEQSRAHTCVKEQTNATLASIAKLTARFDDEFGARTPEFEKARTRYNLIAIEDMLKAEEWKAEKLDAISEPVMDKSRLPDYVEKKELRREVEVLARMKALEEDHKTRDVLALSYKHENNLLEEGELDAEKIRLDTATSDEWFPHYQTWYPTTYTIVIVGTGLLMLIAFPGYFKAPLKISRLSVIVGVAGFVVWIGLIELDRAFLHIGTMLSPTGRDAFNPFTELKSNPTWMWQFLAIRFTGLVLIVPFVEEFFLRGWLMRYIDDPDWDEVPLGTDAGYAAIGVVGYGVVSHLGEPLAAAAWFGMVTWMYLRTKSIWDCVVAHAITNLLLGLYVCYTGKWFLW